MKELKEHFWLIMAGFLAGMMVLYIVILLCGYDLTAPPSPEPIEWIALPQSEGIYYYDGEIFEYLGNDKVKSVDEFLDENTRKAWRDMILRGVYTHRFAVDIPGYCIDGILVEKESWDKFIHMFDEVEVEVMEDEK